MTKDFEQALDYGTKLVGRRVERDDLMQETYLALLEGGLNLDTIQRPLLFTVVKRIAIDLVRKAGHDNRPGRREADVSVAYQDVEQPSFGAELMRTVPDGQPDPADVAVAVEEVDAVLAHVHELPERERQVMLLHLNGMNGPEIAEHLGLKAQTARLYLTRARKTLRQYTRR